MSKCGILFILLFLIKIVANVVILERVLIKHVNCDLYKCYTIFDKINWNVDELQLISDLCNLRRNVPIVKSKTGYLQVSDETKSSGKCLPLCLCHLAWIKKTRNRIPRIKTRISFWENEEDSRNLLSKLSL